MSSDVVVLAQLDIQEALVVAEVKMTIPRVGGKGPHFPAYFLKNWFIDYFEEGQFRDRKG